jgi:hypothetical protein
MPINIDVASCSGSYYQGWSINTVNGKDEIPTGTLTGLLGNLFKGWGGSRVIWVHPIGSESRIPINN